MTLNAAAEGEATQDNYYGSFVEMYDEEDDEKDFSFFVGPNRAEIKAHRVVIKARSPALKRMITKGVRSLDFVNYEEMRMSSLTEVILAFPE